MESQLAVQPTTEPPPGTARAPTIGTPGTVGSSAAAASSTARPQGPPRSSAGWPTGHHPAQAVSACSSTSHAATASHAVPAPTAARPSPAFVSAAALPPAPEPPRHPGLALKLQAVVLSHAKGGPAATAFANELATTLGCVRVSVGFLRRGFVKITAVSHGGTPASTGDSFDLIAAAMEEALEQGLSLHLPVGPTAPSAIRLAHGRLAQRHGGALVSTPIVYLRDGVGAVTCEWAAAPAGLEGIAAELEDAVSLVGPVLYLMHLREAPWRERARRAVAEGWRALRTPAGRPWRWALAAGLLALPGLSALPVDYRVGGKARIEGEAQRAMVAPVDGFLKAVHVRPGDHVKAGQILIELADQDLLLERRKWASEQAQQESAYATALARSERSAMVIALSKADEARARLGLIDAELTRASITAPFDALVLQGDLSQGLGAPVERGKVLMMLAPGDHHRVIVDVDERDVADVRPGQTGSLALSALPWDALPIRVRRVTPIAKTVDGANVFEVETEVTAGPDRIRPGLEGVAKIDVGRQPLGWVTFHRVVDWMRMSVWTWLP